MRKLILSLSMMLFVPAVAEASWCLVLDEDYLCRFASAESCYAQAATRGGNCRENARALGRPGNSRWCVASESGLRCSFRSKRQCMNVARSVNGGCVKNRLPLKKGADNDGESDCTANDINCLAVEMGIQ
jgi:hypothetical protein